MFDPTIIGDCPLGLLVNRTCIASKSRGRLIQLYSGWMVHTLQFVVSRARSKLESRLDGHTPGPVPLLNGNHEMQNSGRLQWPDAPKKSPRGLS